MSDFERFELPRKELKVKISYLTKEAGGRKGPVASGYRGQFFYNGWDWDASQQFIEKEWCEPGETCTAYLCFAQSHFHFGQFRAGDPFQIREGIRVVAEGQVEEVLRDDYQFWDMDPLVEKISQKCKPIPATDLNAIILDLSFYLPYHKIIEKVNIHKPASGPYLWVAEARQTDMKAPPGAVVNMLIDLWKNRLAKHDSRYKISFRQESTQFECLWWNQDVFQTGKVIVKRSPDA